jgi:hypothetical protein
MSDTTPATALRQLIMGFQATHWVYVAAELGIADVLKDGPMSSTELAAMIGADGAALHRVLRGLAQLGVLAYKDDRFDLTLMGHLLRSDAPGSLRPSARMWGSQLFQRPILNLLHTVKTGEAAFDHTFEQDFFGSLAEHPEDAAIFDQGMAGGSAREVSAIMSGYDFSGLRTLVDVGGGHGAVAAAIVRANSDLRGIVFDLPHLQVEAERSLAASGLSDRCRYVAGSFFEAVPEGADAYLLKGIIHDWDDAASVTILRNCRRAMPPQGKVLVVDRMLPPGNQPALDIVRIDLTMLVLNKGRERTEADFRGLFEQSGLRLVRTIPLQGVRYIFEGAPA